MPRIYYDDEPYLLIEPIRLNTSERNIKIKYENNYDMNKEITCITKNENGKEIANHKIQGVPNPGEGLNIPLEDALFTLGSQIFKFECSCTINNDQTKTANILVFLGNIVIFDKNFL